MDWLLAGHWLPISWLSASYGLAISHVFAIYDLAIGSTFDAMTIVFVLICILSVSVNMLKHRDSHSNPCLQ